MKRSTLIAVALLVALLGVWWTTREKEVSVGVAKLELPVVDKSKVTELTITGAQNVVLKKSADAWVVVDPKESTKTYVSDRSTIDDTLTALAEFKGGDFVSRKPENLAGYEIEEPKAVRLKVTQEGGATLELVFGKAAKGGGTYVKAPAKPEVFSTPSRLAYLVRRELKEWRKKQFLELKADELSKLKLRHASGEELVLERGAENNSWVLPAGTKLPQGFRFDSAAAAQIPQQVASLFAQDFGQKEDVTSELTATLESKDGKSTILHLGAEKDGVVPVRVEGDEQVYKVGAYMAKNVGKKLDDLRDLTLMSFDPAKVNKLKLEVGAKSAVLQKEGGAWKVVAPKTMPAGFDFDAETVMGQIHRLHGLRGARVELSAAAAKVCKGKAVKPLATVELSVEGAATQWVRFGEELKPDELCVTGSADTLTYAIGKHEKTWLESGLELFKRRPPPPDMSQMRGMDQLPPEIRAQFEAQMRQRRMQPE